MWQGACSVAATRTIIDATVSGASRLAAAGIESPRLNAELLLAASLATDRTWLAAHAHDPLLPAPAARYERLLARRVAREPLQYIVGKQEFWSLDLEVTPDVLIPRPETELLVELAIKLGAGGSRRAAGGLTPGTRHPTPFICDVGTGSGCIAIALATELAAAEVVAVDISAAALSVAADNARRHGMGARIRFVRGDLLQAVAATFDVIVSNPPYVSLDDRPTLQPELGHEPATALFAGADGLDVIRRLLPQAIDHLEPQGVLLVEIGATQADGVLKLAGEAGFTDATIEHDLAKLPRVLVARK